MTVDWNNQLAEQLDWHWRVQLRPRLDGMTDDEYRWEPVPGMWNIRPRGTSVAPIAAGSGDFTMEYASTSARAQYGLRRARGHPRDPVPEARQPAGRDAVADRRAIALGGHQACLAQDLEVGRDG